MLVRVWEIFKALELCIILLLFRLKMYNAVRRMGTNWQQIKTVYFSIIHTFV